MESGSLREKIGYPEAPGGRWWERGVWESGDEQELLSSRNEE